jgi:hypothetical protein
MPMRSGRLEKRTRLAIPVRICSLQEQEPTAAERTITENVCSLGIRVLASRPRELNERLLINSADGDLQTQARVIYCQPLADGRFAIGLEFPKETTMRVNKTLSYGNSAGALSNLRCGQRAIEETFDFFRIKPRRMRSLPDEVIKWCGQMRNGWRENRSTPANRHAQLDAVAVRLGYCIPGFGGVSLALSDWNRSISNFALLSCPSFR